MGSDDTLFDLGCFLDIPTSEDNDDHQFFESIPIVTCPIACECEA
jgi:hypothetical protein